MKSSALARCLIVLTPLLLAACQGREEDAAKASAPESRPASGKLEIRIETIDDRPAQAESVAEVGRVIKVAGSVTDPGASMCVLVHPVIVDGWWVQPPPEIAKQSGPGTWAWNSKAWLGSSKVGQGDEYEVMAIIETRPNLCEGRSQVAPEEIPVSISRSPIFRVKRAKD
jgi:hypothetical protein